MKLFIGLEQSRTRPGLPSCGGLGVALTKGRDNFMTPWTSGPAGQQPESLRLKIEISSSASI